MDRGRLVFLTASYVNGSVSPMRWEKRPDRDEFLDESDGTLGYVRRIGGELGRWVAVASDETVGWFTAPEEARCALEKAVLGRIQATL